MQRDQGDENVDSCPDAFVAEVKARIRTWIETEWQQKQLITAEGDRNGRPAAVVSVELRKATLTVDTLAPSLDGMSEAALRRKLQQAGAHNPGEMIHRARMDFAARLLREGRYTIAAVAAMAGFDDQRYFAARFREYVGASPRDYRANIKHNSKSQENST